MITRRLEEVANAADVHVFDVDHTLTRRSTGRRFAQAGVRAGVVRRRDLVSLPWFYLRYRLGNLSLQDVTREIRLLTGRTREELLDLSRSAWDHYIAADVYAPAVDHIRRCRGLGRRIVLLSTSLDVLIEPLARYLEVHDTIASELEFEGRTATGWLVGGPCYAEEKARRLAEYLGNECGPHAACAFYSDSFHDLPSFALADRPVAVNPDLILRVRAKRESWPIVRWDELGDAAGR
jgi:HAD superfamily hydrolase (TIGR01490 family)